MRRVFHNGRYANVTATLALFLALGGTSYAALTITGKNIKNGSIKRADLGKSAVTSVKVKNRSLLARDFKKGEVSTLDNAYVRYGPAVPVAPGAFGVAQVTCNSREHAVTGGMASSYDVFELLTDVPKQAVTPAGNVPTGWEVSARNRLTTPTQLSVYAICAAP